MSQLRETLEANAEAVDALVAALRRCSPVWHEPLAPGKWSPAQLGEHVARTLDEAANVVLGRRTTLPSVPALFRPLARILFRRALRKGSLPRSRTTPELDPQGGPETPEEAAGRLQTSLQRFRDSCLEARQEGDRIRHPAFGNVALSECARFVALHTLHHTRQLPGG